MFALSTLAATGCAELRERKLDAGHVGVPERAQAAGFETRTFRSGVGPIRAWWRGLAQSDMLHVYVEGDGRAWLSRTRASADPTPRDPIAFELALRDPHAAVIYLARPCQFATGTELDDCDPRYWTGQRYAADVVAAFGEVLDRLLESAHGTGRVNRFGLVGYSGGAVIGALLAGERSDVEWMVSVAGNLDTDAWTRYHGVDALEGSINPLTRIAALNHTPQLILVGADDGVVPAETLSRYIRRRAPRSTAVRTMADTDHRCCWAESWPMVNCEPLASVGVRVNAWCGQAAR